MQPRFPIVILVLQSKRLMRIGIDFLFPLQAAPRVILPRPQQVAELVGLLPRYADLVGVVVVGRALMPDLWLSRQPENDVWRGRWMNAFSGSPWVGVMLAESSRSGINARPTAFLTALKLRFQVA